MFSLKKEVLKLELKDVSAAKYLKPEAQAEAKAVEEKLKKTEENNAMRLIDIIAQNVEFKNKPLEELDELSFKSILKDEVRLIVETNIQKMNQIVEIFSELDIIYQILDKISDEECTKEELKKKLLLKARTFCSKIMFMKTQEKIRAETNELLGGIIKITKYLNSIRED